jgi:saccharopine dehydrogenase-like NADP-dependent oxidoreductase
MSDLMNNGGIVSVTYVSNGKTHPIKGKLKEFNPKKNVEILIKDEATSLPLLGVGCAVKKIADEKGNTLYKNKKVDKTYCEAASKGIRKECGFGDLLAL